MSSFFSSLAGIPGVSTPSSPTATAGNNSVNFVGPSGATTAAANQFLLTAMGAQANGGFTADVEGEQTYFGISRANPVSQYIPLFVIGGVVLLAVYLARKG